MTILAIARFWQVFTAVLFLLICFLLIVVVLLQRGRGGGLSGAFGGVGGHSAFGTKTGDFFTWLTVCLAGLFLLIAIINNFTFRKVSVPTPAAPQPAQLPAGGAAPPPPAESPAPAEGTGGGETPAAETSGGGAEGTSSK